MPLQDLHHQLNAFHRRNIGQPHHTTMRGSPGKHQFAEIRVNGNENALLARGPLEQRAVPRIGSAYAGLDHVVALRAEPVGEPPPGATVDQKLHFPATRTASRESLAITARAYERQARMSSGSRSG